MTLQLEIVIVCGFLGSGKTTLLLDYLNQPEAAGTAVIVNEVGEIDIDGAIVVEGAGVPSIMLSNGCVCCSLTSDFVATIQGLLVDREAGKGEPFHRILVECSGLSRPGPIVRALARLELSQLDVHVVATFDTMQGERCARQHDEVLAQLGAAHTVVLTKLDQASEVQKRQAYDAVRSINPLATVCNTADPRERVRSSVLAGAPRGLDISAVPSAGRVLQSFNRMGQSRHERVRVMLLQFTKILPWGELADWLDNLAAFCGERLLRLKGFVEVADCHDLLLIQSVGTVFSNPTRVPERDDIARNVVLIARDLSKADVLCIDPSLELRVTMH